MYAQTRKQAKLLGAKYYLSGEHCEHGHNTPLRYTSSGRCVECSKQLAESSKSSTYKIKYSPILRLKDGTVEFLGPYVSKNAAMQRYIERHIEVYGHPPPITE